MRHGSHLDPPNRFESVSTVADWEQLSPEQLVEEATLDREVVYLEDTAQSIVSENQSPDIPFRWSLNPYRGCVHACPYCYARNSHEYLGLNAGRDFETRIFVKHHAAKLFREFLAKKSYQCEQIAFSGVTDCYQPVERKLRLTRACLEVARECHQPISIVTKNKLVLRDLDLLAKQAARSLANVGISLTTLDPPLARDMEPRTSTPLARLDAIEKLSSSGVPVRVMVAPVIPGLNDHEIPAILKAARDAGATEANYILLRLPLTVEPVFLEWIKRVRPTHAEKVESFIRETRGGKMYDSKQGQRMTGTGERAKQVGELFGVFREQLGYKRLPPLDTSQFVRPEKDVRQARLF
ncbi:MAG: PA0069 family radical SAM protein [Lacipirellulaceae bacterium]